MKNYTTGKKTLVALSVTGAIALLTSPLHAKTLDNLVGVSPIKQANKVEKTRYIVKFKDNAVMSNSKTMGKGFSTNTLNKNVSIQAMHQQQLAKHGAAMIMHLDSVNAAATELNKKQLKSLLSDPNIEYVEVDPKRYLIDTVTRSFNSISAISPAAEGTPYGIIMVQANQVSDSQTGNMKVCITDTGYDGDHEDLRPYTDAGITGDDNDGLGNDTGNWWQPGHSHGTHVAGTIAALGSNGKGVVGVNPSGLLDLHNVKIFKNDGNWGYGSNMVKAVEQCRNAGANIISMSIGGGASSQTEENAFIAAANAGVLNIAAAGNDGNTSMSYPASYDAVMSVAAIDSNKNLASFSQRNSQVEIAAPGVAVKSTIINNQYATWDGTSMATPHVSGVAALVWSHFPNCTGNDIRQVMDATAEDLGSAGRDNNFGYGLVKAKAMYDSLAANGCSGGGGGTTPPTTGELTNGVAQTNISGAKNEQVNFTMDVPAGATDISFAMSGGSGDADLYVRFGAAPTKSTYDCRPYKNGNNESCTATNSGGTYYVMLDGYSAFSGVSLVGNYTDASTTPPSSGSYSNNSNVTIRDNATVTSTIDVTGSGDSGAITIDVDIKHTWVGDLKLTLVAPSGASAVLREYTGGSADNIVESYNINATGVERNGTWKLQVNDNAGGDTGYIDSWTVNFN
jgi:serine protease